MGLRWHITSQNDNSSLQFYGCTKLWASSTRAEMLAICTAPLTCPQKAIVKLCTDFQNCIDTFDKIQNNTLTPQKFQKLNNHLIWSAISHIINTLKLQVSLIKVKGHFNDLYNDKVDILTKSGLSSPHTILINTKTLLQQFCSIVWNKQIPIDKDLRKISK
jgi:ribonuclease HI